MGDLVWSLALVAASWVGGMAGVVFDDWRCRRNGWPLDRGYPGNG